MPGSARSVITGRRGMTVRTIGPGSTAGKASSSEERAMVRYLRSTGPGLLAVVWLLCCARTASAVGTWSVIPFPGKPGEVSSPTAAAVDSDGNLYIADRGVGIQERDAQGHW